MTFESKIRALGDVDLPPWPENRPGVRVMMMPFYIDDPDASLPRGVLGRAWIDAVEEVCAHVPLGIVGTGYLTIDEVVVKKGETHRRPGLHVDGVGPNGEHGGWGGGGGYGANGMLMVSSHVGCVAYDQYFQEHPGPNGDCEHLARELDPRAAIVLEAGRVYYCTPMTVHEGLPMPRDTRRQFCRVSFPSNSPWYEGYTKNPYVIEPDGPIHAPRTEFMDYRAGGDQ